MVESNMCNMHISLRTPHMPLSACVISFISIVNLRLFITLVLLFLAGSLRFYRLGDWPFTGDETATLQEVESLFSTGQVLEDNQIYRPPRDPIEYSGSLHGKHAFYRVFPHVTRACQGMIFHSVEIAKQFIERAKTTTGLRVTVSILDKFYETGRKYADDFKANMKIVFDDHLSKWNYRALPQNS